MLLNELFEIGANPDYLRAAERSRSAARDTQRQYWRSPEEKAAARRTELKRDKGIGGYTKRHRAANPEMYPKVEPRPAPQLRDPSTEYSDDYSVWAKGRRDTMEQSVAEGLDQPREAGKAIQSLKNLAVMKSALTMQQLSQAGREAIVTNAINATKTLEQKYLQNKQQGNAIFVRSLRDEIDNFMRGAPINASFPESDNASELSDLLQGKLGKVNFQQSVAEMDKSQPSHGRDGKISHSTYGSRDKGGSAGQERTAKATTADKMMKDAHDAMMRSMSDADKVKKGWRNPNM